jgi:hypothetical protein
LSGRALKFVGDGGQIVFLESASNARSIFMGHLNGAFFLAMAIPGTMIAR